MPGSSRSSSITRSPPSRLPSSRRIRSWLAYRSANSRSRRARSRSSCLAGLPLALLGPVTQPARADPLGLQRIDSPQQPGEQARWIASDLVAAEREVIEMVEQQRQPVREPDGRKERVEPRLQRVLARAAARRPPRRWRSKAPRRAPPPARSPSFPQPRRACPRAGQHQNVLRLDPLARSGSRAAGRSASLRPDPAGPDTSIGPSRWRTTRAWAWVSARIPGFSRAPFPASAANGSSVTASALAWCRGPQADLRRGRRALPRRARRPAPIGSARAAGWSRRSGSSSPGSTASPPEPSTTASGRAGIDHACHRPPQRGHRVRRAGTPERRRARLHRDLGGARRGRVRRTASTERR